MKAGSGGIPPASRMNLTADDKGVRRDKWALIISEKGEVNHTVQQWKAETQSVVS
jgi:hypothetical protein